jgi:hypothetical protein
MSYQGPWQGSPLWTYLVRYDGDPLWDTTWERERLSDWPTTTSTEHIDCVLSSRLPCALQYKTFPPYGNYNSNPGDGGDVLVITDDNWIKAIATSDQSLPGEIYYFVGPGLGMPGDGRVGGWVVAGPDLGPSWRSAVCWLSQSIDDPYHPIEGLSPSYTRYILANIDVPYLVNGGSRGSSQRSCIVAEHYNGTDPQTALTLERFIYAQYMGLVCWEFWGPKPEDGSAVLRAPGMGFAYPSAPALNPSLRLNDARTWTNWIGNGSDPTFHVQQTGWPPNLIMP